MDIQHLVDRLEDLIDEGRHIFGTKLTMIDEERALEIIDQMRISIPEEIEKAARVLAQRDRILAQANEEAARIVQVARERGDQLIDREAMVQAAQSRAANIVEQARQEAEQITRDADNYVLETLSRLEQQLNRALTVVRNGINEVNTPGQPAAPPMPPVQFPSPVRPQIEVSARPADAEQK
jgi:multidrug efflux pump subunit AcrA (membrane-fusion protein)